MDPIVGGLTTIPVEYLGAFLLGIAGVAGAWCIFALLRGWRTYTFVETDGIIRKLTLVRDDQEVAVIAASVTYEYERFGVQYTSSRISVGMLSPAKASAASSNWQLGKKVIVYVDRNRPSNSVLVKGASPIYYVLMGWAIVVFVMGVLVCFGAVEIDPDAASAVL